MGRRRGAVTVSRASGEDNGSVLSHVAHALTASAERMAQIVTRDSRGMRIAQWQMDALGYYDQIGAVRYASMFWGRALTKVRWYVGELDENGEIKETENERAKALLDRVRDPAGGRSVMLSVYGQLRFLIGESLLVWTPGEGEENEGETWEMVSPLEMKQTGTRQKRAVYSRLRAPGLTPEELIEAPDEAFEPLPDEVMVYRFWRRHPAYSALPDSPMRSVLSDCEEVVRATQTLNARLISRLSGPGILAIPQSWAQATVTGTGGTIRNSTDPQVNVFHRALTQAIMAAISKPGSAESVSPIVVTVPDDTTDKAHIYKVWNPDETLRELDLRERALKRFAVGVDMPPEKVLGLGESTHWNAWMIDEEAWEHIAPVAQEFADDLTGAYLRPAARMERLPNAERYVVAYDPNEFLTNPDSFADAKDMYDRRVVGKAYLRAAGDAPDDAAPTPDELEEMLLVAIKQPVTVSGESVEVESEGEGDENPPTGEETERDQPEEPDELGFSPTAFRILGAAEAAVIDMRGRAGSRLRARAQGTPYAERLRGVPNALVAHTLGAADLAGLAPNPVEVVDGGSGSFVSAAVRWGVSDTQALALGEILEVHVARTLLDMTPSLPAGFASRVREVA